MAGPVRHKMADDRHAQQKQIAPRHQDFVLDEFIGHAKAFLVDVIFSSSRIIAFSSDPPSPRPLACKNSTSFRKPKVLAQQMFLLVFLSETEDVRLLPADDFLFFEIDIIGNFKFIRGEQHGASLTFFYGNRFLN